MDETPIGVTTQLLERALEESNDTDVRYYLRQALQLLALVEEQQLTVSEAIEEGTIDGELREQLAELGYFE